MIKPLSKYPALHKQELPSKVLNELDGQEMQEVLAAAVHVKHV